MSAEVLLSQTQNTEARTEMTRRGLSCTSSLFTRAMRKFHVLGGVSIGDPNKSWDVLKTIEFIEKNVLPDKAVLDIGAYGSEILYLLHRLNYSNLTGIDLNPKIVLMPHQDTIRYFNGDFLKTPFDNASFDAVTAISVIEHGFNSYKILTELSRLTKPGGYIIASVDYWPNKIDTSGMNPFGMPWNIFSKDELLIFFKEAESFGFHLCGNAQLDVMEPSIKWKGKRYTFAWFSLKKVA
jgi:SAM-dependent methyltransferase